ncbi:hypothetical protein FRC06_011376 [Ceratobasidium sp. 370]|nr:hypothetical protein FRC06_011376 [Ceratobasidium sp. 370]
MPCSLPDAGTFNAPVLPAGVIPPKPRPIRPIPEIIAPCPSISAFYLQRHHWLDGQTKSLASRDALQQDVFLQPDFNLEDMKHLNLRTLDTQLAESAKTRNPLCPPSEGWKTTSLDIQVPPPRQSRAATSKNQPPPPRCYVTVPGLHVRKLTDVMRKAFSMNTTTKFHYKPFASYWIPLGSKSGPGIRTSGEMYTSPVMIEAHEEVQRLKIADPDSAFMFASDGLQLGNFCNEKGWPIFGYFGNESKYERAYLLREGSAYYLEQLPNEVREKITQLHNGKPPSEALLTHLRRELMHEVWNHLLDDDFVDAWKNGVVITCADGIKRRVFPRILTYSADYPENDAWLQTVQQRIDNTKRINMIKKARTLIYELGDSVQSKSVELLLQKESFRNVPTFGSTIRKFSQDVASMSRLAARDFEDILQCCIAVFSGLLPLICDEPAQRLLFLFAEWHALAKLRLHTEFTLGVLKRLTTQIGAEMRAFVELTKNLDIRETPKEYACRKKQYESTRLRTTSTQKSKRSSKPQTKSDDGRHKCTLNLETYKFHSQGDYVRCVERYGTTDSYSTQINELHNRSIKAQHLRTNKRDAIAQMTKNSDICEVLHDMDNELAEREDQLRSSSLTSMVVHSEATESLLAGSGYSIGQKDRSEDAIPSLSTWISEQKADDAIKFFSPQLKRHLLLQILGSHEHPSYCEEELAQLHIHQDRIYSHRTLHINFTSYDVLRQQDVLNPSTPTHFVMLLSEPDEHSPSNHPFVYAKVLGIYHAKVSYRGSSPSRIDFLHVRWLYYDYSQPGGWDTCRLDRLSYEACQTEQDILDSFNFVNPADVIRATHLIPDFQSGISSDLLNGRSVALDDQEHGDWTFYYVNRFVDRDMLMRYLGGGIGHYQNHTKPAEQPNAELVSSYEYDNDNAPGEPEGVEGPDEGTEGVSELPNAIAPTAKDEAGAEEEGEEGVDAREEDEEGADAGEEDEEGVDMGEEDEEGVDAGEEDEDAGEEDEDAGEEDEDTGEEDEDEEFDHEDLASEIDDEVLDDGWDDLYGL